MLACNHIGLSFDADGAPFFFARPPSHHARPASCFECAFIICSSPPPYHAVSSREFTSSAFSSSAIMTDDDACASTTTNTKSAGDREADQPKSSSSNHDDDIDNSFLIKTTAPRKNREETLVAVDSLHTGQRPTPCDVFGTGPLLLSDIPSECLPENGGKPVVMGIDEAGRGPVLGPMVYGAAFWAKDVDASIIPKDFNDSKQLSAEKRDELFEKIKSIPNIGFVVRVLHASEISRSMLRKDPYNLNAMSHDSAMQMIRAVLDAGVKIDTCYVDTVGIAGAFWKGSSMVTAFASSWRRRPMPTMPRAPPDPLVSWAYVGIPAWMLWWRCRCLLWPFCLCPLIRCYYIILSLFTNCSCQGLARCHDGQMEVLRAQLRTHRRE